MTGRDFDVNDELDTETLRGTPCGVYLVVKELDGGGSINQVERVLPADAPRDEDDELPPLYRRWRVVVHNGNQYRDAYFLFGSACRILAGKVPLKNWQATVEDIWQWSKRKVEELHVDVPDFAPPVPEASPLPPEEPPVEYINDIQARKFRDRCLKLGLTEDGSRVFLKDHGIEDITRIPLRDFESMWYLVRAAASKSS